MWFSPGFYLCWYLLSFLPLFVGDDLRFGSRLSLEEEVIHDRVLSSSLLPFDNEGFLGDIAVLKGFLRSPNARVTISVKKEAIGAIGRMVEARRTSLRYFGGRVEVSEAKERTVVIEATQRSFIVSASKERA